MLAIWVKGKNPMTLKLFFPVITGNIGWSQLGNMSTDNKYLVLLLFSNNFTGIWGGLWMTCILFVSVGQKLKGLSLYCYM